MVSLNDVYTDTNYLAFSTSYEMAASVYGVRNGAFGRADSWHSFSFKMDGMGTVMKMLQ